MNAITDAATDAALDWPPSETRALLRAFFDSPGVMRGIVEISGTDDLKHVADNAAAAAFVGATPAALRGRLGSELGDPPEVLRQWVTACSESQRTDGPVHFEYLDSRKGRDTWMSVVVTCVGAAPGGHPRFSYIANDVSERRRAEAVAQASEQQFRALIENVHAGVALIDETGRFSLFNEQFLVMFGLSRESDVKNVNDQDWGAWQVFDEDGRLLHVDEHPVRKAAMTGRPVRDQLVEVRAPGGTTPTWMLVSAEPLFDSNGRMERIICTYNDITNRRRLEAVLQRAVSELEDANRAKDEFLATLSHELRTPLNAILGWSDMLLRADLDADVRRRALETIRRSAQAQATIVRDLLDVSSIITGKLQLNVRPVDVGDVVRAACESLQLAADVKGVAIRTSVEGHPVVAGDADRLRQIVWNLVSNSVRFTGRGGHVDITVASIDSQVEVQVRDDGVGIAADYLPHVFERFWQADSSTSRRQGGLGLGLAIVRSLTELHGGTVAADSGGPGKGAVFSVRLPVQAVFDRPDSQRPSDLQEPCGTEPIPPRCLEGVRILVVDDEEEARGLIEAILERYGGKVTSCGTAESALATVGRERPDLLLADIGMPGCDGYELIRRVRALPDSLTLPAIALTAYGGANDRARALSAGFWEHLAKPVLPDALVRVIVGVLGATTQQ